MVESAKHPHSPRQSRATALLDRRESRKRDDQQVTGVAVERSTTGTARTSLPGASIYHARRRAHIKATAAHTEAESAIKMALIRVNEATRATLPAPAPRFHNRRRSSRFRARRRAPCSRGARRSMNGAEQSANREKRFSTIPGEQTGRDFIAAPLITRPCQY